MGGFRGVEFRVFDLRIGEVLGADIIWWKCGSGRFPGFGWVAWLGFGVVLSLGLLLCGLIDFDL